MESNAATRALTAAKDLTNVKSGSNVTLNLNSCILKKTITKQGCFNFEGQVCYSMY